VNQISSNQVKFQSIRELRLFQYLNQIIPALIGIFIFFNPFPHTTAIKEVCFYLSVFIVLLLLGFRETKFSFKTPLAIPVGLFLVWATLGVFFAFDKKNTIHDLYSHLLRYIVLYYILVNFFSSKKHLVKLSWVVIISTAIFSVSALFYFYIVLGNSISVTLHYLSQRPSNVVGVLAGFSLILALTHLHTESQKNRRAVLIICLFPLFAILIVAHERSTFIAILLAGLLYLSHNKIKALVFLSVMVLVVTLTPIKHKFTLDRFLRNERIGAYLVTLEIIKDHPITGIGYGLETYGNMDLDSLYENVPDKYRAGVSLGDPHNIMLDVAVRLGVVGLALFLYIMFVFFKMCWLCIRNGKDDFIKTWGRCMASAFVLFFVIGFFQPVFSHVPEVILWTMFAMITVLHHLNYELVADGKRHQ
jgi:O-antigen ligase